MSNSSLVNYTKLSPNCNKPRNHTIDTITIHHMAGNLTVEKCGEVFAPTSRQASSNYGVDSDGRVGMYVEECNRSWCSSSAANDNRAVTIEVANDKPSDAGGWHVSDKALEKTIELCVDICKRNGIKKLNYTGDKTGNLTMHKWFKATACPGPYLESKFPYIADEVNKRLNASTSSDSTQANTTTKPATTTPSSSTTALTAGAKLSLTDVDLYTSATAKTKANSKTGTFYIWSAEVKSGRIRITNAPERVGKAGQVTGWIAEADAKKSVISTSATTSSTSTKSFLVKVTSSALNIRKGAGTSYGIAGVIKDKGTYTIIEEKVIGTSTWGRLKSGAGWICLTGYTTRV